MRLRRFLIGICAFIAIGWVHQSMAQDIKITDYDVPVSQSHQLYITGNILQEETGEFNDYRWEQYGLAGALESFYNSPHFAWQVIAQSGIAWTKYAHQSLTFAENASTAATIRRYFNGRGLFFGGANLQASWFHDYHRPNLNLGASVGLGRTIEAAVLARAIRIDDFLLKEGTLNQHLPPETLLELAAIIDREDEYRMQYGDTYTVWWYEDMDRLIAAATSLPGGSVGPVGLLRIREVLEQERIQRRTHGWTIETGVMAPVSRGRYSDPGDPAPFAAASYAWPLGLKHQLRAQAEVSSTTGSGFGDYYDFRASLHYTYELTNRTDLVFSEEYLKRRDPIAPTLASAYDRGSNYNRVSATAYYYVENAVSIRVGGYLSHTFGWTAAQNQYREYSRRHWLIDVSVGYHVF